MMLIKLLLVLSLLIPVLLLEVQLKSIPTKIHNSRNPYWHSIPFFVPTINLCFGLRAPQCLNLGLDLGKSYIFLESAENEKRVFKNQFNTSLSPTYTQNSSSSSLCVVNSYQTACFIGHDVVTFNSMKSQKRHSEVLPLVLVEKVTEMPEQDEKDGFLGLHSGYLIEVRGTSINASFVDYLYNTMQITRKSVMLHYSSDSERSTIAFGESYDNYKRCNKAVQSFAGLDDCTVDSIIIGDRAIVVTHTEKAEFSLLSYFVKAATESGTAIFSYVTELSKGKCREKNDTSVTVLLCENDFGTVLPDIQLRMEEVTLAIKWSNLFKWNQQEGVFVSLLVYYTNDRNYWTIGLPGLMDKRLVFDYDEMSIGFLEDKKTKVAQKRVCCFCLFMLLIGILLLTKYLKAFNEY